MGNTTVIAVLDVLGTVVACPLVAYGLSRLEWKGRELLFFITIAVMMIPQEVTMVPTFILFNKIGLTGTYVPLFIQSFFGRPFMIFLLRQFFMNLPHDLEDAARVDGAGWIAQFFKITLPIIKPQVALALIMSVTGSVLAFEQFSIMTKGGPSQLTTTSVHYIYNTSFNYFKLGYGSAMTVVILLILGALSLFQYQVMKDSTN